MNKRSKFWQLVFLSLLLVLFVCARQAEACGGNQANTATIGQLDVRAEALVPKTAGTEVVVVLTLRNETPEPVSDMKITRYTDGMNRVPVAIDLPAVLKSGQAWSTRLVIPATDSPSLEIAYENGRIPKNSVGIGIVIPEKPREAPLKRLAPPESFSECGGRRLCEYF